MRHFVLGLIILWACCSAFGQAVADGRLTPFHLLPTRQMRLMDEAINPETPAAKLRTLLADPDPEVRSAAARALGTCGELSDIPLLARAEQTAPQPTEDLTAAVRIAVTRLQTRGDNVERQVAALLPFLHGHPQVFSFEAVRALSELHHETAVSALTSFARSQATDARVLAKLLPCLPATVDAGLQDQLPKIELAIQAYLPFADYFGRTPPPEHITSDEYVACGIAYWRIRFSGLKPEEKITIFVQDPKAHRIGGLIEGLLADRDQHPKLLPLLNRLLLNKTLKSERRDTIAFALAKQDYQPAADSLLHIIRDTQEPERLRAQALSALTYYLHDPRVAGLSVEILRRYREQQVLPLLTQSALDAIGQGGLSDGMAKTDIEPLVLPFLTEKWPSPLLAIKALCATGTSQSVSPLLEIAINGLENLPDQFLHDSVRWNAMKTLGHIGDKQAEPFLLSQLDNHNANYRIQAIQALTFMNSGLAIPRFADIIRYDEDNLVVRYAVSALCQMQGKAARPFFTELLAGTPTPYQKELFEEALVTVQSDTDVK